MTRPEKEKGTKVLTPGKYLTATKTENFRKRLIKAVGQSEEGGVVLDFTRVEAVDSAGLGLIIAAHNTLANYGRKLTLTNVSKEIYGLFLATRLDQQFEVISVE